MSSISIRTFCLVTLILRNVHSSLEREIPRRSFLSRRAIDGTRGSKYFDPGEEGAFDSYGSAGGQYDPYEEKTDLSDIRRNVPGEPGLDYPAYTTLPQTGFTCEGRSRGYYADQVAGCQVFHVCHDVLVSSFLCPIGSTFSQKLLTCDWWTKVDCSSSDKYVDANRNSYQQDDDEMIRNAYAMISLRSGTDLTKDGLVDPDRIGTIVNYRQPAERVPDYASEFSAGNDLRNNDEYATSNSHRDSSAYALQNANPEPSRSYQERPYTRERTQSPYQDSPIIRVQPFDGGDAVNRPRNKHLRNNYPRPNEFNNQFSNQFQPSYAPTVPTVTTTTRRFYSPTVPTTFRPSTLAYDKLDQTIDNSNYFFSRSGTDSFVTPPTIVLHGRQGLKSPEASLARRANNRDYGPRVVYEYQYNYEGDNNARGSGNRSPERFQGVQNFETNRTNVDEVQILFDRVRQRVEEEEEEEDIEARDSVGLGHALRQSIERISGNEKSSADDKAQARKVASTVSNEFQYFADSYGTQVHTDYQHTLARPEVTVSYDQSEEQTTEHYRGNDKRSNYSDTVVNLRIPLYFAQNNAKNLNMNESESSVNYSSSVFDNLKKNESSNIKFDPPNEKQTDKTNPESRAQKPSEFLSPPDEIRSKFQIKVPDLTDASNPLIRHSTLDGSYSELSVTEPPPFVSTIPTDYAYESTFYGEDSRGTKDTYNYSNDPLESFNSEKHSTSKTEYAISSTSPSFSSPSPLLPPVFTQPTINYTDNSNDFSTPNEWRFPFAPANKTEEAKTNNSAVELQFPVSIVHGSTTRINFDIDTTTAFPSSFYFSGDTTTNEDFEETATTQPDKKTRIPVVAKGSDTVGFLKTDTKESTKVEHEDLAEAPTANALLRSIGPDAFQRIEERIEKNGSPYQVTVTVTKGEKLDLEVIESVEPEINFSGSPQRNLPRLDTSIRSNTTNNSTNIIEPSDSKKPTFNTVNLLQLMSELLKLNRVPRPFSRAKADAQSSEEKDTSTTTSRENSTLSANESSQASTKKQILNDRLTENLEKPRTDRRLSFDLPQRERILDFRTGLPTNSSRNYQKSSFAETILSTTSVALSKASAAATATTTPTPKATRNTEAGETVVKTEFVPSIGFSLNTDEERKEYVEAVLRGLIESQPTETEEREVVVAINEKEQYPKNETVKI